MATPITLSIPHQLGRAEARRRIEAGFSKITHLLPGSGGTCSERWDGDRLTFAVRSLGQRASGTIDVNEGAVRLEVTLPWLLSRFAHAAQRVIGQKGHLMLEKK